MNRKKFGLRLASLAVFLLLPLSGAAALEEMDGDLDGFINEYLKKKSQGILEK